MIESSFDELHSNLTLTYLLHLILKFRESFALLSSQQQDLLLDIKVLKGQNKCLRYFEVSLTAVAPFARLLFFDFFLVQVSSSLNKKNLSRLINLI